VKDTIKIMEGIYSVHIFWYNMAMRKHTKSTANTFLLQMFSAGGGALLGSLLAISFFMVIQFVIQGADDSKTIIDGFLLFGIGFLSALFSNIFATLFLSFSTQEFFGGRFREGISQIFFGNVLIMGISSPIFLLSSQETNYDLIRFLLPFSAISSMLLYEAFSTPESPILFSYKAIASGITVAFLLFLFFPRFIPNEIIPFFFLPIVWFIIPAVSFFVEKFHSFLEKK
jgi:hypothetical protein